MTRDESTEGWLPLAGGGLANVSIRKRARPSPDVGGYEYIIFGQRVSDQTVSDIISDNIFFHIFGCKIDLTEWHISIMFR